MLKVLALLIWGRKGDCEVKFVGFRTFRVRLELERMYFRRIEAGDWIRGYVDKLILSYFWILLRFG